MEGISAADVTDDIFVVVRECDDVSCSNNVIHIDESGPEAVRDD